MSKNAMAGAVTLCGVGLCLIGGAMVMQSGSATHAASSLSAVASAVASTASAQASPTIVWYGLTQGASGYNSTTTQNSGVLARAWSNGLVEARTYYASGCGVAPCGGWITINDPVVGYRALSDANADERVDAADLTTLLSNWGDAPRVPFPPSDCPLNLINP